MAALIVRPFTDENANDLLEMEKATSCGEFLCKATADSPKNCMTQLLPITHQIQFSAVELPAIRQSQLDLLSEVQPIGEDRTNKVLASIRFNEFKNVLRARRMGKLEKTNSRFTNLSLLRHTRTGAEESVAVEEERSEGGRLENFEASAIAQNSIPLAADANLAKPAITLEWIILVTNFILEIPSAVLDQLASAKKPQYALISMLISFIMLLLVITELVYKGRKQRVRCQLRGRLPWFYYTSPREKLFGTFADVVGFVCAIFQCVFATISYAFFSQRADNPIKISFWPMTFAFGLLCSKLLENPHREDPPMTEMRP